MGEETAEEIMAAVAKVMTGEISKLRDYVDQRISEHEERAHVAPLNYLAELSAQMREQIEATRLRVYESRAQLRALPSRYPQQGHPDHDPDELRAIRTGEHRQRARSQDYVTPLPRPVPLQVIRPQDDATPYQRDEDVLYDPADPAAGC